jgi:hypothetical protein
MDMMTAETLVIRQDLMIASRNFFLFFVLWLMKWRRIYIQGNTIIQMNK